MNENDRYTAFALAREMMEVPEIIRAFTLPDVDPIVEAVRTRQRLALSGEGSSRIFPAKNAIHRARQAGSTLAFLTEGSRQLAEYPHSDTVVIAASNSGATREVIALANALTNAGHDAFFGLTATPGSPLEAAVSECYLLSCGAELAVAATKSVVEQALFYQMLAGRLAGEQTLLSDLASAVDHALRMEIPHRFIESLAAAPTIYFAGRNDGVAEELTLKTNEITRKKSDYLEGTYAVHGIEEVMSADDVVIAIDPFPAEIAKLREVLVDGVGLTVIAVASMATELPTIQIPEAGAFSGYVQLAAGWNLLVETGLELGIDLDHPVRARKVGNAV